MLRCGAFGRADFARREQNNARLFDEGSIEIDRARGAKPGLDAKKAGAGLGPEAKFAEPVPRHVEAGAGRRGEADRAARDAIHDDGVGGEQILAQLQEPVPR